MITYKRRVEFAETDAAGMVHFSVFFRYMEEAEHAVWQRAGMDIFANHEERSWPRIAAAFDFTAPLKFQDEFEVRTEIGSISRSTIQWAHTIVRGNVVIGSGTVTAVYVVKNYPDLRNTVTDLLIGDLFDDKVDKVWKPMESLYPADKKRLLTWNEGDTPDAAGQKANELVVPKDRRMGI